VVRHLLGNPDRTIVGHNLSFDLRFLMASGIEVDATLFDTYLASQILDGGEHQGVRGYHSLASVVERELAEPLDKTEQKGAWAADLLTPTQLTYAARDAAILLRLHARLQERLGAEGLADVAAIENACVPAMAWMAHSGMAFDQDAWVQLADTAVLEHQRLEQQLHELLTAELGADSLFGKDVNLDSPAQLLKALADLGIDAADTNEETLAALRGRHSVVPLLLEYREASKRSGAYGIEFVAKHLHPTIVRIHADFRQIGAASGRMSCTNPNLQNIPRDRAYRACFAAPAGRALVRADLSQIELVVAAELSGDGRMIEALANGLDLHQLTAAALFKVPPEEVTKRQRGFAKSVNFGTIYGQGTTGLINNARTHGLTIGEAEARAFQARFNQAWPQLARWRQQQMRANSPVIRTASGRIRRVQADISGSVRANTPIQGTAADLFKVALGLLWETRGDCPGAFPVAAVHDELVVEADAGAAGDAARWVADCLQRGAAAYLKRVPVRVEATVAADWSGSPLLDKEGLQV
jgi:DNA polymerase-1